MASWYNIDMYNQIDSNKRQTYFILLFFSLLIIGLGWVFSHIYGSQLILYLAVGIAVLQSWISYFFSDSISLAVSGAKEADRTQYLQLHQLVENIAITAGLPKPKVFVINDDSPNAFATGRNPKNSAVAVTTGLLKVLDKTELEGVVAHELAHIGNRDTLVMTVAVTMVGAVVLLSDFFMRSFLFGPATRSRETGSLGPHLLLIGIVLAIIAPIFAKLIQLAISRKREYLADATGALLTRYPEGLASALSKIESYERPMRRANRATAHLYINEPFGVDDRKRSYLAMVFSTHPPIHERVEKLRSMAN